ncbi:MAG: hypothetical protein ABIF87_11725, partial [Pseudomonadota bacterium]
EHKTDVMGNEFLTYQPCWYRLVSTTFRGIPIQHGTYFHFTHPHEVKCVESDWPDAPDAQAHPPL